MISPYAVTHHLELALAEYTGAPFVCCVNSGTAAIQLACKRFTPATTVTLPEKTYCSVPMAVIRAGHRVEFKDYEWQGQYRLAPLPVWDSARRMTSGMYNGDIQCISFATNKILGVEQGGAILHSSAEDNEWYKRMRFDGRTEGVDPRQENFDVLGEHCLMLPSVAATLLLKLFHLPKINADLPHYDYPNLSKFEVFK